MTASTAEATRVERALARQILSSAGTMIGICTTFIGLVKIVERHGGPSHVDEYAGLTALVFLLSAVTSYIAIRQAEHPRLSRRFEQVADWLFLIGLVSITGIVVFFAYEVI